MKRQKIVAGNWKMNLSYAQAMSLSDAIAAAVKEETTCEIILASPFVYLHDVLRRIGHRDCISIAAQNVSDKVQGAYTGEVSAAMLASVGVEFALVGHSERREFYSENDNQLAAKVDRCLENGIIPVFCCGERLAERETNRQMEVVAEQLTAALFHLTESQLSESIIAYEPVWAIGTGKTATAAQAQEMHANIRQLIQSRFPNAAGKIRILYGGSVTASNASELFACNDVDGALVGGASLKAADFISIIHSCNQSERNLA
jgi:triosephosphate isomerase